jgi:monoamine oxidase
MGSISREEFIKKSALLGLGLGFMPSLLASCEKDDDFNVNFSGETIIIGAGSAGLMAGYTIAKNGGNFTILEAASVFGGRIKKSQDFTNFPIDLGAEWIHEDPEVFSELIDNEDQSGSVDLISYNPKSIKTWNNDRLRNYSLTSPFYREYKFKNTTWYDFFEDFIVPSVAGNLNLNSVVNAIDYSNSRIVVTLANGTVYEADRVLITVPIKILQQNNIVFTPPIPTNHQKAIDAFNMPGGLKVFMEFSERFYPDMLVMGSIFSTLSYAEQLYYDAAFKKGSGKNILALFAVGPASEKFVNLSEQEIIDTALEELDEIFEGKATQYYQRHIIQNWSTEPFIQGSYSFQETDLESSINQLRQGLENKLFFAGEAITNEAPSTVHGAGFSGIEAAKKILQSG